MPRPSIVSSKPSPATASMPEAIYPAYGMAEATLLISGGRRGAGHLTRSVSRAGLQSRAVTAPGDVTDAQLARRLWPRTGQ